MHTFDFLPAVYANIYVYRPHSQPHSPCLCYRACALTVMMIEYTCVHEQQWRVCWWLNPNQSFVKSVRHYTSSITAPSVPWVPEDKFSYRSQEKITDSHFWIF